MQDKKAKLLKQVKEINDKEKFNINVNYHQFKKNERAQRVAEYRK